MPLSSIAYIFEHAASMQVVFIDQNQKGYFLYLWEKFDAFCSYFHILTMSNNPKLIYYTFTENKNKISDLFYAKHKDEIINKFSNLGCLKQKVE